MTPQLPTLSPPQFIAKWRDVEFGEKQASQELFLDLCGLVGHPTPVAYGNAEVFTFEKWVPGGFADAYLEDRFGWEFKGSDDQLPGAFNQLLRYQVYLKTPPLLIVSSFRTIRIRTNFPGMETVLHEIPIVELERREHIDKLRNAFFAPDEFRPHRSVEDVTRETAELFRDIVADMERHTDDRERLARYLNRIVFCLYAEDAGLLPDNVLADILNANRQRPDLSNRAIANLFEQMAGGGLFGAHEIAHFNGDLFRGDEPVELSASAMQRLGEAVSRNWRNIEPSIFGTLFERALDASQRARLGAHYTGADDIMLVVNPVVMDPLEGEWEAARREIEELDASPARQRLEAFRRAAGLGNGAGPGLRQRQLPLPGPARPAGLGKARHRLRRHAGLARADAHGQAQPDARAGNQPLRGRAGPHRPVDWLHPVAPGQRLSLHAEPDTDAAGHHPADRRHTGPDRSGASGGTGMAGGGVHHRQPAVFGTFP